MTELNEWFTQNYKLIEAQARQVLRDRYAEGISLYYEYLYTTNKIPEDLKKNCYNHFKNYAKPNSPLNYIPVTLKGNLDDLESPVESPELEWDLQLDLKNEEAIDFLLNNKNNEKWMKIYETVYRKHIDLNLFENILFDYVFIQGLSIREISVITGSSTSFIYKIRKELINKIKLKVC